jgi:hypothetical protein
MQPHTHLRVDLRRTGFPVERSKQSILKATPIKLFAQPLQPGLQIECPRPLDSKHLLPRAMHRRLRVH